MDNTLLRPDSGYLITEDEQFAVLKVRRVMNLFHDLVMHLDPRDVEIVVDPKGWQRRRLHSLSTPSRLPQARATRRRPKRRCRS